MVKTAVVTGGAKGIGQACVFELAKTGYHVHIWDSDFDAAQQTAEAVAKEGGATSAQHVDVSDGNSVANAKDALGGSTPVSVLVNSAGILSLTPIQNLDLAVWDRVQSINLRGPLVCIQALVDGMQENRSGVIINIVSNVVVAARMYNAAYSSAKAGLLALTQVLALELAEHNIRVNAVSPGSTKTALMDTYDQEMMDGILKGDLDKFRIGIPLGRFAETADHAKLVGFLASEDAKHITGQNIIVDGGQTLA